MPKNKKMVIHLCWF